MTIDMMFRMRASHTILRAIAACISLASVAVDVAAQSQVDRQIIQLRQHTEGAIARGDLRSAEMLIDTYLTAAQRHPAPTWHLFNGHLIACRIKLALDKTEEAVRHSTELDAIVSRSKRTDTMEHAIAVITRAQVQQKQGHAAEAAESARTAIAALRRAHERGRITRRTFETELLAYEDVLIQASAGRKTPTAP